VGGVLVDTGPLRRHPGFRRLWTGQVVASVGSQLTVVAVGYQTYRLTGSTAMVGLVSLGQLVPLLAGSVLGGPAVDAWDRRKVMLVTQVLLAAGCAGLAINAMLGHPLLWPMFVCTAESAAFQSVDWAARRASLRRLVPPADLAGGGERAGLASLIGGVRYLRSSRPLAGAFLIDLGAMVFGMPRALFPALAATVYHGDATTVGYLNAAPGLGALIGSLLTGHVGRVRRVGRAVTFCVVAWGLAITGFGLVSWLPAALALLVLAGAADVVSSVFRMIIVQQATPDALQGRVNSLVFAGLTGGPRLGDAESGAFADVAGPQAAAWSGGLLSVATAVVTCWAIPQFWRYQSAVAAGPAGHAGRAAAQRGPARGERGRAGCQR
jgi:MFS family permease